MADYWGARATYPHGGPSGEGTRYVTPPQQTDLKFTPPPADEGGETIEAIRVQLMGQHPEDISALADQWQNAYNLLHSIHQQLFKASQVLHDETWKSPQARDAFLQAGPGKTLAYLDEWMDATLNNVAALRAMVGIARDSRAEMDRLWTEYQNAINDAKNADGWTQFSEGFKQGFTLGLYDGEKGIQAAEAEAVQEKQKEYNRKAQQLAHRTANEYFDTMSKVSGGHGPPFFPMDAVLNPVGHPPWRGPTGVPPAVRPPVTKPPVTKPPVTKPPQVRAVPRPTDPTEIQKQILERIQPPPPVATPTPTPTPSVAPPPVATPPMVAPPPGVARTGPPVTSGPRPSVARPPGLDGLNAGERGAMRNGVIRGGTNAPVAEPPQASLRSPGATSAPPPGGGRAAPPNALRGPGASAKATPPPTGARGGPAQTGAPPASTTRRPGAPGTTSESTTGRTPGRPGAPGTEQFAPRNNATTPPVLQNRQPTKSRPGTARPSDGLGSSTPARPGTSPSVLGSSAKGGSTPPATPARSRRDQDRTARPVQAGGEWLGDGQPEGVAPILDAPLAPPTGARVSRLEEVPSSLRGRPAASAQPRPARGGRAVPPELAPRRTSNANPAPAQQHDQDEQTIVTDEQAFSVETPGGGVVGRQAEDRSYRAEPKTALGGGN
ncbi:hypothetical protein [Micromonospora avicenniae]|uniref:PPE family protein n=1 Tax=Micromonospora avicenniae TaxID=1198245 RepID=A0A1N7CMY2_9ACTN|nr:hypothetical protein [Micromonospora avicenniae]SIR64952.1 hypothetical protein SAMN05444858_113164 [Micromonospora avicenniae]